MKESEETEYTISFSFYGSEEKNQPFNKKQSLKNKDGIIIFDVIEESILKKLKSEFKIPIILVDNHRKYEEDYSIDNDDFGGAYKATKYLIRLGHTNLGYIGTPDSHPLGKQCWEGFKKALNENNLEAKIMYKECTFGIKSGKVAIDKILLKYDELPTGFFCMNDHIAIGAMEELKTKGYKVPDDISIIGMDDIELSSEVSPSLTTIRINMQKLGSQSIKIIIKLIKGDYTDQLNTIIDNELIIRDSCKKF